jgi:hypothetical protein
MKSNFFVAALFVAAFAIASDGCNATSSGTWSFCSTSGETCSSNDEYCGASGGGVQHKDAWVRCTPPLSSRWQLVAVRITRTPNAKIAGKG